MHTLVRVLGVPNRGRPGYPAEALRAIEAEVRQNQDGDFGGANSGDKVLIDLGCGTGKFTREILPFAESEGTAKPYACTRAVMVALRKQEATGGHLCTLVGAT